MRRSARRASSSSNRGLTLVELLVTLVILSILAAAALP
ncbi:MAG: prepilin-type N-terminal cleavage/methylation domain-containing protein, partial [Sulfurifustaceae bacterium]